MLKKDLRKIFKQKRDELSKENIEFLSRQIQARLIEFLNQLEFQFVNCFLSSHSKNEVQTQGIIQYLWEIDKNVSVPHSNYENSEITSVEYLPHHTTSIDSFGIPSVDEPISINYDKIQVVLIALFAFDDKGNRIGYGKGMYDRFLSKCPGNTIKIGLSFFDSVDEISDVNEFDVPLDYAVTPSKVYRF